MSFSNKWDERYQENTHMSIWPWSDLVSLVMHNKPPKEKFRVLELGCGAGANIPLFIALGADYYAVEGSQTIVNQLHKKFPQFKKRNSIIVNAWYHGGQYNEHDYAGRRRGHESET